MGCGASKPDDGNPNVVNAPPHALAKQGSLKAQSSYPQCWAKGVGTSFEFLNEQSTWQPITDPYVINQLGKLCAYNNTSVVTYNNQQNGQSYRTSQGADGLLLQTNRATNATRSIRLVPFFFEFEEGRYDWKPVSDPQVLMGLTAVLASSLAKRYKYTSATTGYAGEAETTLIDEKGLLLQRNIHTQKLRRIRATPVGPDGDPHFEFHDDGDKWNLVSPSCVKQLAAVAVGRGDAYYDITHRAGKSAGETFSYHAKLGTDGFVLQRNTRTGAERQVRPAPWRGHATNCGQSAAPRVRADPTNGYIPGAPVRRPEEPLPMAAPVQLSVPVVSNPYMPPTMQTVTTTTTQVVTMQMMPAQNFYVPEMVPMGSAGAPVALEEMADPNLPMAAPIYYYQPELMEPSNAGDMMAMPMGTPVHSM